MRLAWGSANGNLFPRQNIYAVIADAGTVDHDPMGFLSLENASQASFKS
jgi:hypothetical protein